jgi:hypothetical protein
MTFLSSRNFSFIKVEPKEDISDYRYSQSNPLGRTPPVDGEIYDMVRCYTLRRSTVRMLSKIKVIHNDDLVNKIRIGEINLNTGEPFKL